MDDREALLRRAYEAFNSRDIEAALALMTPDVDWPNAMDERRERGQGAVRAYWLRQFAVISPHVEPERFSIDEEGRVVVDVHQVVRDIAGGFLADRHVQHVYALRGGKNRPHGHRRAVRAGARVHGCDSRGTQPRGEV